MILTAEVAIVQVGLYSLEGLMDENGVFYVGIPQITSLKLIPPNRSLKQVESLIGTKFNSAIKIKTNLYNKPITAINIDDFTKLVYLLSMRGDENATTILRAIDRTIQVHSKTKNKTRKQIEKQIQISLSKKLKGHMEVETLAGRIDILTSTEIIEVKTVSDWKSALGQILVYGDYYPSHSMRIHLFGETQESFLNMVKSHCNKRGVNVTWQQS